jgi:pimeloyl-ACP methyl ester carboxylesterase
VMSTEHLFLHSLRTNVRICRTRKKALHTFFEFLWNTTPRLSKGVAKRLLFAPSRYRTTHLENQYLNTGSSFEISVHGKVVKCWKWGSGPSILLAHGWNGRGIQLHCFIEPLLRKGYSVIAYDAPGHGESQGKTSSYFEFTDTIRMLLNSSNGHRIQGVIAHSLGASATVNSMVKENEALEVVLIAPALRLAEVLCFYFDHIGVPKPLYRSLIKEYEDQFGYTMQHDNPSNLLKEINSRILIVHDKDDPTIPYFDSKELSGEFQNITLHTTERLGHKKLLTDRSVIDLVANYFEEQKMVKTKSILEEYKRGDLNKRLNLFLEYPSIRSFFAEIDQREIIGKHANKSSGKPATAVKGAN